MPNTLSTSYSFTTADSVPPTLSNLNPAASSSGNPQNTNIVLRVNDPDTGVDPSTFVVRVQLGAGPNNVAFDGATLTFQSGFTGPASLLQDLGNDFLLTIDLSTNPSAPVTVTVQVDVSDYAGNAASFTYTFDIVDTTAPFVIDLVPSSGETNVVRTSNISFTVDDADSNINLATVLVTFSIDGGAPISVYNGGFQVGYNGPASVVTASGPHGRHFVIDPTAELLGSTIDVHIEAEDSAPVPNSVSVTYRFYLAARPIPTSVIEVTEIHALLGSIISLDGRRSSCPDGLHVTLSWTFLTVPIGSVMVPEVGTPNSVSITPIRDDYRAISFIPDVLGTYVVGLTVSANGSESILTATTTIGLSLVPSGEGVVPDLSFLWRFLSSFWSLVEDRSYFEVLWSVMAQVLASDLTRLWSIDSNKSLLTIQNTAARRWQKFSFRTELDQTPQSLIIGNCGAGDDGDTGPIVATVDEQTNIFRVLTGTDNLARIDVDYGAKGRLLVVNGAAYTIDRVYTTGTSTVVVTDAVEIPNNQANVTYRIPHLLHTPQVNLEEAGVSAGDVLVLEVVRKDTGLTAELRAQVVAVDGFRLGFEFTLSELVNTDVSPIDHALFRQLVQDLRIIKPSAVAGDIAAVAETFIHLLPTGINLAQRPWTEYQFQIRAKEVVHNTSVRVDDRYVSVPTLQFEIKQDPETVYLENIDYVLSSGYIQFQPGRFTTTVPSPDELWAELTHIDNGDAVEGNFGRIIGLRRGDLVKKATRVPYLSAVTGLWYALMNGPSVENVRLALHIMMGLPVSVSRGTVIAITPNFSTNSHGDPISRILIEDVDQHDRPNGNRRFYFYPEAMGLATNPNTRALYIVGDMVEAFTPLSLGIDVTDRLTDQEWWVTDLVGQEVKKYHTFRALIDTETGIFNENDLAFSIGFLRSVIRPLYADVIAAVRQRLNDNVMADFDDPIDLTLTARFYDNAGYIGRGSAARMNNVNQGVELWRSNSRPFRSISPKLVRDVVTSLNAGNVRAASTAGLGLSARVRVAGDATHPFVEGDILVILSGQAGAGRRVHGYYEMTSGSLPNGPVVLGNVAPQGDPRTWVTSPPDSALFQYGSGLHCSIVRRVTNPLVRGADLVTAASVPQIATSATARFKDHGVAIDDHLIIESGANKGEYRIVSNVAQTSPRTLTSAGVPQVTNTNLRLVALDGSNVTLASLAGQDFRIIRPAMMRTVVQGCRVVQSGGNMFVECTDFGGGGEPFDVFTPGMVNYKLSVSLADNPLNDGRYTVLEYVHAGRVRITTGAPQTSDVARTAVVRIVSIYHPGFERAEDLAPAESFDIVVS